MQHHIPIDSLGPQGAAMAGAVSACVHCGFCLPVCPTYTVLQEEMDSPRGRIFLMKEVLEGALPLNEALPYVDRCLGCVACVPACPSGVAFGDLLVSFRAFAGEQRSQTFGERLARTLVRETLPYPGRFRTAAQAGQLGRRLRSQLSPQLAAMVDLVPESLPEAQPLPPVVLAEGTRRARVALLAGCVQHVLAPDINWATVRVLARNGVEVVIPAEQGCCGALSMHTGEWGQALSLARHNLGVFPEDVDAIVTNAAGCGSGIGEYPLLFTGQPEASRAEAMATQVRDVSSFLVELGWEAPPELDNPLLVAYHDPCHLAHAQGVREAPRRLLASIPGLTLLEVPEGNMCCGSAGTYNLEQPELAGELGRRKAEHIASTNANALATGNIGCLMQIQAHLKGRGRAMPLYHTVQVLDRAYARTL
jgi:glycolate oxidase iron-sulfur subunit